MELSFARCKSIVDTLPIGLYTGRRIPLELVKDEETSYYSITEDKIIISYPIIAYRFAQVKEGTCDEEEAVRSMLYHEVSHAILTPTILESNFQNNCMEDQRIETILKNYYHGVDFRKQIYDIHGGHAPKATDAKSAFFNAVRFGLGTAAVQKEVNRIIKTYATLNRVSRRWDVGDIDVGNYENAIYELWRMIQDEFEKHPEEFSDPNGEGQGVPSSEQSEANGEPVEKTSPDLDEVEMAPEQLKRMVGASLSKDAGLKPAEKEQLDSFQKTAETIINNFKKKNSGGSGINTYSGVFNPRAVARKDYRYFERSMSVQGNNKFGSCHLNLFIDCSGSFCDNVKLTNGILAVLSNIERKNHNFSMDVVFINHQLKICKSVRERQMTAWGGNSIPENMKNIILEMQKPQTCNYNIILFDGDAVCNDYRNMADATKRFRAFDMKQATLITDPDNEQYMNPPFSSTKVVVTQQYTKELIRHITNALMIAFG